MRLQTLQRRKKMSCMAFAKFLGVTPGWLSHYYGGRHKFMADTALQIIERLNYQISLAELCSMRGRGKDFNLYG